MQAQDRMRNYRSRLRSQGLRPVQIWVPDQRTPGFRDELRQQIQLLNQADEREALDFIEQVADWSEE